MISKDRYCSGRWTAVIVCLGLTLSGTARSEVAAADCDRMREPSSLLAQLDVEPRAAYEGASHVFYATTLVPARPCSRGFCAGVRIDRLLKGDVETNVVVVVYPAEGRGKKNSCPPLLSKKHDRHLFFTAAGVSKSKGIVYYELAGATGLMAARTFDDIETLQGRYLLHQARLDRAIERRLNAKR